MYEVNEGQIEHCADHKVNRECAFQGTLAHDNFRTVEQRTVNLQYRHKVALNQLAQLWHARSHVLLTAPRKVALKRPIVLGTPICLYASKGSSSSVVSCVL